jgi:spore coat polysaccharide biosynthesis predicted glycosyltransferase SpsG
MILAMSECNFAVIPASSILFECIASGLLCLICYYVENQRYFHDYVVNNYAIPTLNKNNAIDFNLIKSLLENKHVIMKQDTNYLRESIGQSSNNLKNKFNELIITN